MAMPERYVFVCLNQAPCGGEVDGSGAVDGGKTHDALTERAGRLDRR